MPPKSADKEAWSDEHTMTMLRGMISLILNHRSHIYSFSDLKGVADNGGDRVNKKIQQALKKLCDAYPGAGALVDEELKHIKNAKSGAGGSPKKSDGGTPKKRKVKDEE